MTSFRARKVEDHSQTRGYLLVSLVEVGVILASAAACNVPTGLRAVKTISSAETFNKLIAKTPTEFGMTRVLDA